MLAQDLREDFIAYFRKKQHKFLNPVKVTDVDKSLFFVNSGMCQLKKVFLEEQEYDEKYNALTNCQICIRCSGKHNDLDDVGKDTYHLTSFGMLGNWSLNKYWKEEAIRLAFEYLTTKCNLKTEKMYATYFEGNDNVPEDIESKEIWKKYLPESHIVKGNFKDNFWMMGETGPCGACSEIHYDLKDNRFAPNLVNVGDPTLIEVWNLVFMEYNAIKNTNEDQIIYAKLNKKFVDTGAGHERLAMIVQNKKSVYQIDIFQKLFCYAEIVSSVDKYTDDYDLNNKKDIAYRIFVDHIRTCVIAIFDGTVGDCNNRGFVLRKIVRKLLLNYYLYLNNYTVKSLFNHHIINALITEILNFHLLKKHDSEKIRKVLLDEEILYVGIIYKLKNKYDQLVKSKNITYAIEKLLEEKEKLKTSSGIDEEFITNMNKLKFIPF